MPGVNRPFRKHFLDTISTTETQQGDMATQQYEVISDPTGVTGDATHGHAVFVKGWLKPITGISAYGAASYRTGSWVQL
jgi:hypothetical protein